MQEYLLYNKALMSNQFSFELQKQKGKARAGVMTTPHGQVETPIFMPVGTLGSVKSLDSQDLESLGAQIILGNTYHLYLRPGTKILNQFGGLHNFMQWQKPMLTDSGGFQVYSLAGRLRDQKVASLTSTTQSADGQIDLEIGQQVLSKVSDEGVEFISHYDGSKHFFSPQKSIEIQQQIGADIIMTFDECLADSEFHDRHQLAVDRTSNWAKECLATWEKSGRLSQAGSYQALFGIVQGGVFEDLRTRSAHVLLQLPFDGYAVGGETIGYHMAETVKVMRWLDPILPTDKPRYAMGLGRDPQDLVDAVLAGFDMFDCVGPTRLARNGALYVGQMEFNDVQPKFVSPFTKGRLSIGNSQFASDGEVILPGCDCHTCQAGYSRAYLHHLYRTKELSYYRLASIHNLRSMLRWVGELRKWILKY